MTSTRVHFGIIGAGAVGGYFGAKLALAGHRVSFVARGRHLKAIQERGLAIWSPLGDFTVHPQAESDAAKVGPVDVVIFGVKSYDNDTALPLIAPLLGPSTVVLTLQNGISSADDIAAVIGRGPVLGGATFVATGIKLPGLIVQTGIHRSILFGESFGDRSHVSARVARLGEVLAAADIQVTTFADARQPVWEKFVHLCPFSGFTGATRLPSGAVWGDAHIRQQMVAAAAEVMAVANAEGVSFSPDFLDRFQQYMTNLPGSVKSSLLMDLEAGKRIEVEGLQGALVRRAAQLGVSVPVVATLYAVLKPYARGAKH